MAAQDVKPFALQPHEREPSTGSAYGSAMQWRSLIDKAHTPSQDLTVGILELSPGARGNLHWHEQAEVYFILEGTGEVEIDGVVHPVKAETTLFIPRKAPHSVANTGDSMMRLFYSFAADGLSDITYHFANGNVTKLA